MRTAQYAFEFALLNNRKKVTAVHKANIMKQGDGLFLKVRAAFNEGCRWSVLEGRFPGNQAAKAAERHGRVSF